MKSNRIFLALILGVGILFRFWELSVQPVWFYDEAVNLELSSNLLGGETRLFALTYPFFPHPPLFHAFLIPLTYFFGKTILAVRLLSATLGVATIVLTYKIGKILGGQRTGLIAAAVFAVTPLIILFNRGGFAHNQVMFLIALSLYLTLKLVNSNNESSKKKISFLLGAATTLAVLTEYYALSLFFICGLALFIYERRHLSIWFAAALIPSLAAISLLFFRMPEAFKHDLFWALSYNQGEPFILLVSVVFSLGALFYLVLRKEIKHLFDFFGEKVVLIFLLIHLGLL
ncbi:MAG: glycosyltransferase family 39 protein, partial [Candidatus Altiarchaeota archaeon]